MKIFFIFTGTLFSMLLVVTPAAANDTNSTQLPAKKTADANMTSSVTTDDNVIRLEDSSGLSAEEVREIAAEADKAETKALIEKSVKQKDSGAVSQPKKAEAGWVNLFSIPMKYDWIELKSGEWLKGKFKAMYNEKLEFDSKEMDLQTFDFEDIRQVRTHHLMTVSILVEDGSDKGFFGIRQTKIEITGIIRLDHKKLIVIRGDGQLEFDRDKIISIAYGGEKESDHWSGKITFGLNINKGNTEKFDYTTTATIQRRTSKTRLEFDYLGNISRTSSIDTANNHRLNEDFDIFVTKRFYYTPLFSEYFTDTFQNIRSQITAGVGIGYTIINTHKVDWDVSGGPAILYTVYDTVQEGTDSSSRSAAFQLSTSYDLKVTKKIDFNFDYKITFTDQDAGNFKHHMVTTLENEFTSWLDIDISLIWDYTEHPQPDEDQSIPEQSDVQLVVSLGVDF